jgi:hypothetical protein
MSQYEPSLETIERERTVLDCIMENPSLHHNALVKMLVPEFMAKTTFEKTRDSLLEKNVITVKTKGNMKFYFPTVDYETKALHYFEKITNLSFHNLKNSIKRLGSDYPHKDIDEKINTVNLLLKNLFQTDVGFTFLDSAKNPKKTLYRDEHLEIQQLIFKVFEIIRKDKDHASIFPTIVSYLGNMLPKDFLNS